MKNKPINVWRKLFGFSERIDRRTYAIAGFSLMILKYALDSGAVFFASNKWFRPWDYLNPVYSIRSQSVGSDTLLLLMAIWSLPFCWIGVSMSVRRSMDAGRSPWLGTLFFFPLVNYALMIYLCLLPSQAGEIHSISESSALPPAQLSGDQRLRDSIIAVMTSVIIGLSLLGISIYLFQSYGATLFFAGPFFIGIISAVLLNRKHLYSLKETIGIGVASVVLSGAALLLFALEGIICLAMAAPIGLGIAVLGSCTGYLISQSLTHRLTHACFVILLLPLVAFIETKTTRPAIYEVVTAIEINAPPEKVWENVVTFSELPEPTEWVFKTGLAYPQRAKIEGSGVGAIRYCEFSTGPFIEPITIWDQPHRLAFNVTAQPVAMKELTPFQFIHPPHLDGTMQSQKGEFRLKPLPNNRTLLEGHTWYKLQMRPENYWTIWSDWILHRIHRRVLTHVKNLSEAA